MNEFNTLELLNDPRGFATLWLSREEKNNAFNAQMIRELILALDKVSADPTLRFLLVRGRGKHFSAGADLAWMQQSAELDYHTNLDDARELAELMYNLAKLKIPTLAVVQGAAFGGALHVGEHRAGQVLQVGVVLTPGEVDELAVRRSTVDDRVAVLEVAGELAERRDLGRCVHIARVSARQAVGLKNWHRFVGDARSFGRISGFYRGGNPAARGVRDAVRYGRSCAGDRVLRHLSRGFRQICGGIRCNQSDFPNRGNQPP